MKKQLLAIALLHSAVYVKAQTPHAIPYQAAARTSSGAIIASQPVGVRFTIRDSAATGAVLYTETHSPTTTAQGLFTVQIGQGTPVSGTFSSINWGHNAKYLQVELDATGGTTYTHIGTQQLLSVPYALYAENAGGSNGWADSAGLLHNTNTTGRVGIGTTAPAASLHVADSSVVMTGGNAWNNTEAYGWMGTPYDDVKDPPVVGLGDRMMWYADKAAFRMGNPATGIAPSPYPASLPDAEGDVWNKNNTGYYSFGAGFGVVASGDFSCALGGGWGRRSSATGMGSVAIAWGIASGVNAVAIGYENPAEPNAVGAGAVSIGGGSAYGASSIAIGPTNGGYTGATGPSSIVVGNGGSYANASGSASLCLNGGTAVGFGSIAIGNNGTFGTSEANGDFSVAVMGGQANGNNSLAIGSSTVGGYTLAEGYNSMAILGGQAYGDNSIAMLSGNTSAETSIALGGTTLAPQAFATFGSYAAGQNSFAVVGGSASGMYSCATNGGNAAGNSSFATIGGYASGSSSFALGPNASAGGNTSIALGVNSLAMGEQAAVLGSGRASGNYSTTLGHGVSTNEKTGAFAIGDWSVGSYSSYLENDADNQMVMRFAGGYKLYSDASATVGVALDPSSNSWSVISDKRKKENFRPIDGNGILKKIGSMPLSSWNYKGQDPKNYRHYGPMAQDFYAAFGNDGVGTVGNDTTINQADMAGVTFAAVQSLVSRDELQQKEIDLLKRQNEELMKQNEALKAIVKKHEEENNTLKAEVNNINANLQNRLDLLESKLQPKIVTNTPN